MKVGEKLDFYLEDKGFKKTRIAKRLGISGSFLSQILRGERKMPSKYWLLIVEITQGLITIEEMENEYAEKKRKQ